MVKIVKVNNMAYEASLYKLSNFYFYFGVMSLIFSLVILVTERRDNSWGILSSWWDLGMLFGCLLMLFLWYLLKVRARVATIRHSLLRLEEHSISFGVSRRSSDSRVSDDKCKAKLCVVSSVIVSCIFACRGAAFGIQIFAKNDVIPKWWRWVGLVACILLTVICFAACYFVKNAMNKYFLCDIL